MQVGRLLEALAGVAEATRAQVEKRAALSFEELQAELAEAEEVGGPAVWLCCLSHTAACVAHCTSVEASQIGEVVVGPLHCAGPGPPCLKLLLPAVGC